MKIEEINTTTSVSRDNRLIRMLHFKIIKRRKSFSLNLADSTVVHIVPLSKFLNQHSLAKQPAHRELHIVFSKL